MEWIARAELDCFSSLFLCLLGHDLLFEDETGNTFKPRFSSSISLLRISHYTHTYVYYQSPINKGSKSAILDYSPRHNERHDSDCLVPFPEQFLLFLRSGGGVFPLQCLCRHIRSFALFFASFLVWKTGMQNTRGTRGIIHNPGYLLTPCSRALVFGKHATPGGNVFF